MARVRRTATARGDLKEIWHYVAADSEGAADRLLDQIEETVELLGTFPMLGRPRNDLRMGMRSFPVGNYLIFYKLGKEGITVVRVLSGYRDLDTLFRG